MSPIDPIDRYALIHKLKNSHYPGEPDVNAGIGIAIGKVWDAPTIEPETEEEAYERGYTAGQMAQRKKGHWTGENACEFCGFQPWFERDIHTLSYCPNCGADMRGEQE